MSNILNMTSSEVSKAFFKAAEGKTKEERKEIYENEYRPILKEIQDRNLELGRQGWMIGN